MRIQKRCWLSSCIVLTMLSAGYTGFASDPDTGRKYAMVMTESDVTLANYKGKNVYFWKHDISDPSQLIGGKLTVTEAGKQISGDNALVTLVTDHSGLDLKDESAVRKVLQGLADKLVYTAYTTGERNLDARAEIYEGLTFASASMKMSGLGFDETSGKAKLEGSVQTPFTTVLTGNIEKDKEYKTRGVVSSDGVYRFTEDTVIHPDFNVSAQNVPDQGSINIEKDTVIDMGGYKLHSIMFGNLSSSAATPRSCAIYIPSKSTLIINNPGAIDLWVDSTYYYYGGVGVMSKDSHLIINNDNDPAHRVLVRAYTPNWTVNVTGLKTFDGTIDIKGLVDIYTNGAWGTNAAGGRISVGGGRIHTDNYTGVTARSGGIMNVNVSGSVESGLVPGTNPVTIVGGMSTKGYYVGTNDNATVNVALTTPDSTMTGIANEVDGITDAATLGIRLFLQNGATWYNTGKSSMRHFYGGKDAAHAGIVDQTKNKAGEEMHLARYSGYSRFYYGHDADDPQKLSLGQVYINKAERTDGKKAQAVFMTDAEGFGENINDKGYTDGILFALAQKLIYQGHLRGEDDLEAYAGIAEGITSPEFLKKTDIIFMEKTGRGYIRGFEQEKTEFTTTLTGVVSKDEEYRNANVLKSENAPIFSKPSKITVTDREAILPEPGATMSLTLGELALNIDGKTKEATGILLNGATLKANGSGTINVRGQGNSTGISIKKENDDLGLFELNADVGLDITVNGVGIRVSGNKGSGWQVKKSLLTVQQGNKPVSIINADKEDAGFVGIQSTDGGTVLAKRPITIDAGKGTAIDGYGTFYGGTFKSDGGTAIRISNVAGLDSVPMSLYAAPFNSKEDPVNMVIDAGKGIAVDASDYAVRIGGARNYSGSRVGNVEVVGHIVIGKSGNEMSLVGKDSFWRGALFKSPAAAGSSPWNEPSLRLLLREGAVWYHERDEDSKAPGQLILSMTSAWGDKNPTVATIVQNSACPISINSILSANDLTDLRVVYKHEKGNPENILGGDFILEYYQSNRGSARLTGITDADGISLDDEEQVEKVLDALAHKFVYKGLLKDKWQFSSAIVGIAEALTSPGVLMKKGNMNFITEEGADFGRGYYKAQKQESFTAPISDDETISRMYKEQGIWGYNGFINDFPSTTAVYNFEKDTEISSTSGIYINFPEYQEYQGKIYRINGMHHSLLLEGTQAGIYAANKTNRYGAVTVKFADMSGISVLPGTGSRRSVISDKLVVEIEEPDEKTAIQFHDRKDGTPADYVAMEAKGSKARVNVSAPVHINAPGGTALLASPGSSGFKLDSRKNIIDARKGYLLQMVDNIPNNGDTIILGKELLGDIDIHQANKVNVWVEPSAEGGYWTGAVLNDKTLNTGDPQDRLSQVSLTLAASSGNDGKAALWNYEWQHPELAEEMSLFLLSGGNTDSLAVGTVHIKAETDLLIQNLSKRVRFYYEHDKDDISKIIGGDVKIEKANMYPGEHIFVRTDQSGINMADKEQVEKVLDALAHKIYYTAYDEDMADDGKLRLAGTAEIAEGLTSLSARKTGTIGFTKNTGQGYVVKDSIESPSQSKNIFETPLTGNIDKTMDLEYKLSGIYQKGYYVFSDDSVIRIKQPKEIPYTKAVARHATNDRVQTTAEDENKFNRNIYMEMNGKNLGVFIDDIDAEATSEDIIALYAKEGDIMIHGADTVTLGAGNKTGGAVGIRTVGGSGESTHVVIGGTTNITAKTGFKMDGGTICINAGRIETETLAEVGENSSLSIGTSPAAPAVLTGDWKQTGGEGQISLGKESSWTGMAQTDAGRLSLIMTDGAVWKNTGRSVLYALRGGLTEALVSFVDQTQGGDIETNLYSGNMTFFYKYGEEGPQTITGGKIVIRHAEEGSHITLMTDREAITDDGLLEKEMIEPILDILAQKLYYSAYKTENNLKGTVKIAEGLTARSAVKVAGNIFYTGEDGQGRYKQGSAEPELYPSVQMSAEFHTPMTGDKEKDTEYLRAGVMKIAVPEDFRYKFTMDKNRIIITGTDHEGAVQAKKINYMVDMGGKELLVNNDGDTGIHAVGKQITFINGKSTEISAMKTGILAENGGVIIPGFDQSSAGTFHITAPKAVRSDGEGSKISIQAGTVYADILAEAVRGGQVEISSDWNGTHLIGDAVIAGKNSRVNIGVASKGSTWTGGIRNDAGTMELGLMNGGIWVNTGKTDARITSLDARIDNLGMGSGIISQMKESGNITADVFAGKLMLIYAHDAADPTNLYGGTFTVKNASPHSAVILRTDRIGLDITSNKVKDKNLVSETLNALAGKLYYEAYVTGEKNLAGTVEIAEGLTAQSASMKAGDITYKNTDGQGQYLYTPAVDPNPNPNPNPNPHDPIIYGDKETQMMKGSKTAMTAAALLWRGNNNDLERRMGDIRLGKEENGIWARYLGGKNELDKQKTSYKQTYNIAQAGYDKKKGNWTIGMALDYGTGKDTYANGTGKEKLASLSLYGTMQKEDGQYIDIILKGSRIKNDYTVYNEMNHRLEGKYKTSGVSVSMEYGKRMQKENGIYIEPSIELTAGHLKGKDYDAVSDYGGGKKMHIHQDAVNSVIGRIGLGIGKETEKSNLFAKIGLAHEFGGKIKSVFSAEGEPTSGTEVELKDSWIDVEVGGSWLLNRNTYLYGTYTRNFGADLSNKWRIDAGIRFSF